MISTFGVYCWQLRFDGHVSQAGKNVILIFSVHGGCQFDGVATVTSVLPASAAKEFLAPGIPATLHLDWLKKCAIYLFVYI